MKTLLAILLCALSAWAQSTGTGHVTGSFGFPGQPNPPVTGLTDLVDLGSGNYSPGVNSSGVACNGANGCTAVNFQGGLYPGGTNTLSGCGSTCAGHLTDGNAFSLQGTSGNKTPVLCLGFSNLQNECAQLITDATGLTNTVVLNAGQSNAVLCMWTVAASGSLPTCTEPCAGSSFNAYNNALQGTITPAGFTESQIQVVIFKAADHCPEQSSDHHDQLPCTGNGTPTGMNYSYGALNATVTTACTTQADYYYFENLFGQAMRAMKVRYPNLKMVLIYSRIYGGYATIGSKMPSSPGGNCGGNQCAPSPERYAYEEGLATKAAIGAQITQCPTSNTCNGTIDSTAGDLSYVGTACSGKPCAGWMAWLTYVWADATTADTAAGWNGLMWCNGQSGAPCNGSNDFQSDATHPSATGQEKVASCTNLWGLCNRLKNLTFTSGWFN